MRKTPIVTVWQHRPVVRRRSDRPGDLHPRLVVARLSAVENLGGATHDWFASTSGYNAALADKIDGFNFIPFLPPASAGGVRMEEHRRIPIKPDGWAISYHQRAPDRNHQVFRLLVHRGRPAIWPTSASKARPGTWSTASRSTSREVLNSDQAGEQPDVPGGRADPARLLRRTTATNGSGPAQAAREGIELYDANDLLVDQFLGVAFNAGRAGKSTTGTGRRCGPTCWSVSRPGSSAPATSRRTGTTTSRRSNEMGYDQVIEVMNSAYARQYG